MKRLHLALNLLLALCLPAGAWGGSWIVVPEQSHLGFTATFEGAELKGELRRYQAEIVFDPEDLSASHFDVRVDVASIDTGSRDINEGLALPEWLDVSRHPWAAFRSASFARLADSRFEVHGTLTIKGVTRDVVLPFTWSSEGDQAGIAGEAVLQRGDFNLGEGDWADGEVVGLGVRVWTRLQLRRAR